MTDYDKGLDTVSNGVKEDTHKPIIPDYSSELDEILVSIIAEIMDIPTKRIIPDSWVGQVKDEAKAKFEALITKQVKKEYQEHVAELEIAMHHELDLMENMLVKDTPINYPATLSAYVRNRHREIEQEFDDRIKELEGGDK